MTGLPRADDLIARALAGLAPWSAGMDAGLVAERAIYHGVTGLLIARAAHIASWPEALRTHLRAEAVAQTMWEIRHRTILVPLLAALARAGVAAVLLKGTALAYGLYPAPAQRNRGDTDLLVAPNDLQRARAVFHANGFACNEPLPEATAPDRQESWIFISADGGQHEVDLHVEVFSSPALIPVLTGAAALAGATPLHALSPQARALPLPLALLHACLHRAQHVISPYFVGGQSHYGGDRMVWLMDIDLALRAMTTADYDHFVQAATTNGVGPICAAALRTAESMLGAPCPASLIAALTRGPTGPAARYLTQTRASGRVIEDLRAIPGLRGKLHHAALRLFPPAHALRARYPDLADAALPYLYLRRLAGIWQRRMADRK